VRSRVTNIYPYLETPITIEEFKETLWQYLIPGELEEYVLSEEEWAIVHELKEKRYARWEWNYGASLNVKWKEGSPVHRRQTGA